MMTNNGLEQLLQDFIDAGFLEADLPAIIAAMTPEMRADVAETGPRVAQWLLDVAEAARAINSNQEERQ